MARSPTPALVLALIQARFATGSHELYQVAARFRARDRDRPQRRGRDEEVAGSVVVDAIADAEYGRRLMRGKIEAESQLETDDGVFQLPPRGGAP